MIKAKKTLEKIKPYSIDPYYQTFKMKLDSNENPYGASPSVVQAIRNFDPLKISIYPAYGELIDKLSELTNSKPDNFVLTNGCDEAISVLLNTFLEKDDILLSFSPTFSMPKIYCDVIGAIFKEISYDKKWSFDLDKYVKNITDKTKILYITSPNNPTGEVISTDNVRTLAKKYEDKLIVLDCTYFNYSEIVRSEYYSLVGEFKNIALVKSFSKDYALAGLRLGYIFADPSVLSEVKKVISPYSVNALAVNAGLAALSDIPYFLDVREKINKSKRILVDSLNSLGYKAYSTEANFILCDFSNYAPFIYQKLLSKGIRVKYFKNIDTLENVFRITVPKLEDVEEFLSNFEARPLFVFDLDGVVFDVKNSYRLAIKKTFEHFTGYMCSDDDIQEVKHLGGMSNDWNVCELLIKKAGFSVEYDELVKVFQGLFFNPEKEGSKGLIDNEENVLNAEFFSLLTKYADCAVFTSRPQSEAFYSLEKFGIKKYFSYFITNEDVEGNFKPSPFGLNKIKENCKFTYIKYFGDTVDDIEAGVKASVQAYGVIPPKASCVEITKNKLIEMGAKGVIEKPDEILKMFEGNIVCK